MDNGAFFQTERLEILIDDGDGGGGLLNKDRALGAAAEGFDSHRTRAGVSVQKDGTGNDRREDVEERFAHAVRRGADLVAGKAFQEPGTEFASDDAHSKTLAYISGMAWRRAIRCAFLLCAILRAADDAPPMELWYWHHSYVKDAAEVIKSEKLIDQAADAGYTGMAFWDSSINFLHRTPNNAALVRQVVRYAKARHLKVMPLVAPFGHSADLLRQNPNWAEGQRVVGTRFQVQDKTLRLVSDFRGVRNGGFESGSAPWLSFGDTATKVDATVHHSGTHAGLISGAANPSGNARFFQQFDVIPWRQYHLRMFIKEQGFHGFSQLLIFGNGDNARNRGDYNFNLPADRDWTQVDFTFNSGDNKTISILFGVWGGNRGNLWFDDISMEETALVYVLRGPSTPLKVYDPGNPSQVYREGVDYAAIADPKLAVNPNFDNDNWHQPMTVPVPAGSALRPGQAVAMDFYAAQPIYNETIGASLTDEGAWQWMIDNSNAVARVLPGVDALLFGYDEMRHMNSTASAKAMHMTPAQLLDWHFAKTYKLYRAMAPRTPIYVWNDMFDPFHNAHENFYLVEGDLAGSWKGLPADVIVMNWNLGRLKESATWFSGKDPKQPVAHKQVIAGFYDAGSGADAAKAEWEQVRGVPGICGMMYTTWNDNYSQLKAFADAARAGWPKYLQSVR